MARRVRLVAALTAMLMAIGVSDAGAWSNGTNCCNSFETHDWIAKKAIKAGGKKASWVRVRVRTALRSGGIDPRHDAASICTTKREGWRQTGHVALLPILETCTSYSPSRPALELLLPCNPTVCLCDRVWVARLRVQPILSGESQLVLAGSCLNIPKGDEKVGSYLHHMHPRR